MGTAPWTHSYVGKQCGVLAASPRASPNTYPLHAGVPSQLHMDQEQLNQLLREATRGGTEASWADSATHGGRAAGWAFQGFPQHLSTPLVPSMNTMCP